jgi:hypothetical protein
MKIKILILFNLCVMLLAFAIFPLQGGDKLHNRGDSMDYEKLKIKSYKHWDLYLHENQCYLGRVFVQLKDEKGIEDFLDIEGEVRDEFFFNWQQNKTSS